MAFNNSSCATFEGSDPEAVWQDLEREAARQQPGYYGIDGARARFLRQFPDGFADPGYARDERDYKIRTKRMLDETAPLAAAANASGLGEAVLRAFREPNLLHPVEKSRVATLLRSPDADAFIQAAARFARFPADAQALAALADVSRSWDCANWTILTFLPFLWRPEVHMFLKPEVTKDFATRVGHRFARDYDAAPELPVYDSLLVMAAWTEAEIADLHPRDRIDIQSFIWVAGKYPDPPAPTH